MADDLREGRSAEKSLGDIVSEVSEKASLLVREEIELAKTEVTTKVSRLAKGAAIGAVAGLFAALALIYFLFGLAYLFQDITNLKLWVAFMMVTLLLLLLGAIGAFLAFRLFKKGSPPMPAMAIEEAKKTRAMIDEARH